MSIFAGFEPIVKENEPMARHTCIGWGAGSVFHHSGQRGRADRGGHPLPGELGAIYVLGGGANLLVSDDGSTGGHQAGRGVHPDPHRGERRSPPGRADMSKLTLRCVREGLAGMECLTGVPGSVGGAVKMNAGGNFGDIGTPSPGSG